MFPWDAEGWHTPLAYVVTRGNEEMVELLLERGADAMLRSPERNSLSEVAQKAGYRELAVILEGAAAGKKRT